MYTIVVLYIMTDALVLFREGDIKGAVLEERAVEKNNIVDVLRRWIRSVEGYRPPPAKTIQHSFGGIATI